MVWSAPEWQKSAGVRGAVQQQADKEGVARRGGSEECPGEYPGREHFCW